MTLIKKSTFVVFGIFIIISSAYPQDLLDYTNSFKYADYLFNTHQYNLAVVEFERVVFLEPKDTIAKLKLVQSYRYLNDYITAMERIEIFFPRSLSFLPQDFSNEYIKNLLYEHQFQKAYVFLQNSRTLDIMDKKEYQLGILVMQNQWSEAKSFADEYVELLSERETYNLLYGQVTDGLNINYKSPALAASLSAIIPGSGKVYTKQWKDAIYSFLFVSAAGWLTYRAYTANGLGFSSIFWGTVTIGFYSANIYGSHKSAKRFNDRINQSITTEAETILLNDKGNEGP